MRKAALAIIVIFFVVGISGCTRLATSQGAVAELRITSAPSTVSDSLTAPGDTTVSVSIENFTDTSDFDKELATAYLTSYVSTLYIGDTVVGTVEIPSRVVIKSGATIEVPTVVVTQEEKRNMLKTYGKIEGPLVGYAVVVYNFSDSYGNKFELVYKPVVRLAY